MPIPSILTEAPSPDANTGQLVYVPWSRERLENEHHALDFIAANYTSIPVPRVIRGGLVDDAYRLVVEYAEGWRLDRFDRTVRQP